VLLAIYSLIFFCSFVCVNSFCVNSYFVVYLVNSYFVVYLLICCLCIITCMLLFVLLFVCMLYPGLH